MKTELRKTGIKLVGDILWGTHFCHFYETKNDLLDILIPYFKTGLKNHEFCMWLIFKPLDEAEATNLLRQAIPNVDQHLAAGDIQILPHHEWNLKDDIFDPQWVIHGWKEKLDHALRKGYAGMRVNGFEAWLSEKDWEKFSEYEKELNELIADEKMIVLCTYPLEKTGAREIFDVARAHQFVIAMVNGKQEILETPELQQAKKEIKSLNTELERRVDARTTKLADKNIELISEIFERKRIEERLQEYEKAVEGLDEMIVVIDRNYRYVLANRAFLSYRDLEKEQLLGRLIPEVLNESVFENEIKENLDECFQGNTVKFDMKYTSPELGERDLFLSYYPIEGPEGVDRVVAVLKDVTESVQAEEQLKNSNEKLRALTARLQAVREEESIRIAREIHDELGGALTGLKMDISWLNKKLTEESNEALRQKFKAMSELVDETVQKIRNISTQLRPALLDDLGLAAAIESQCQESQTRTGIKCRIISLADEIELHPEKATAVFRIFQEILTNISRHSRATLFEINMKEDDGSMVLKVSDNGIGIKESDISDPKSLGILGMFERAYLFGGQIEINGEEGKGTTVTVRIPRE